MEHEHGLVNWTLIPPFLKEAIIDFPFESTADAQDFSNLMVSRMRCRLLQAPELDDSAPRIERYLEAIEAELLAGARFTGKCYFANYRIHRPAFYKHAFAIMRRDPDRRTMLSLLRAIDLKDDGERDPTRAGPVRFPWQVSTDVSSWTSGLSEALAAHYHHNRWTRRRRPLPRMNPADIPTLVNCCRSMMRAQAIVQDLRSDAERMLQDLDT